MFRSVEIPDEVLCPVLGRQHCVNMSESDVTSVAHESPYGVGRVVMIDHEFCFSLAQAADTTLHLEERQVLGVRDAIVTPSRVRSARGDADLAELLSPPEREEPTVADGTPAFLKTPWSVGITENTQLVDVAALERAVCPVSSLVVRNLEFRLACLAEHIEKVCGGMSMFRCYPHIYALSPVHGTSVIRIRSSAIAGKQR